MMNTCIFGLQWGDEGKGKIVDYIAEDADIVVRYQGGPNAGHTVYVDGEKYVFHMVPAGILNPHTKCVMANGMVVNLDKLLDELEWLNSLGINTDNIYLSNKAHVITQKNIDFDFETNKIGTTNNGIGPCYSAKVLRTGQRVGDVSHKALGHINVVDTKKLLNNAIANHANVLFEGAQGIMLDIDHGSYPYVTSSSTGPHGIFAGCGLPITTRIEPIGICKAYATRVGDGPFPGEITNYDVCEEIRTLGNEFGATTGRERRIGWLDLKQIRYALELTGCKRIVLTKLDIVQKLGYAKIFDTSGKLLTFQVDNVEEYLSFIEKELSVSICMVSNGKDRTNIYSRCSHS